MSEHDGPRDSEQKSTRTSIQSMEKNLPKNTPPKEERDRIVDAVMKPIIAKTQDSEFQELQEMAKTKDRIRDQVKHLLVVVVEECKMLKPTDPRYIHSERGRTYLLSIAAKMFIEHARTLSREEAIFMLGFAWAELELQRHI